MTTKHLRIALLCGGPSRERGISLNSARSVLDHLHSPEIEVCPVYFDVENRAYALARAHLYSNTPDDFEFKIDTLGTPLPGERLIEYLRSVDLTLPAIHGAFGEGGPLQRILEEHRLPYIGSPPAACELAFDKYRANRFLVDNGYFAVPSIQVLAGEVDEAADRIDEFFEIHDLEKVIVKPVQSGSSIGVYLAESREDVPGCLRKIFDQNLDDRAIVEPLCEASEFTLIVLENDAGDPVALLPTEIEISHSADQLFDYRKKYLPTRQVTYHAPPRYPDEVVTSIRRQAAELFARFGMRDFARFDGWVFDDGRIWFSDFNLVSGMEQNSFLFLQAAQIGMSHSDLLRYLVRHACRRHDVAADFRTGTRAAGGRQPVDVIFGGDSSERHVSLMSGTNVWLKLATSEDFAPRPFLLDPAGSVWRLPYAMALRHTVEEVVDACEQAMRSKERLTELRETIVAELDPPPELLSQQDFDPERIRLDEFIDQAVDRASVVFIALHGGIGENGVLQARLESRGVRFTGSGSEASKRCMDKWQTTLALEGLEEHGITSARKRLLATDEMQPSRVAALWRQLVEGLDSDSLIVKPNDDGCSSGVARLFCAEDLGAYLDYTRRGEQSIPAGVLTEQHGIIEMPVKKPQHLLFEEFVETDKLGFEGGRLEWTKRSGWIEITNGVLGTRGRMRALTPSVTVATGNVLSLEEKFQGGTGINVTPPPEPWVSAEVIEKSRRRIERVAEALGIEGFARIDAFLSTSTGEILVIEANTIPGLTPSTVIFHQALQEEPPLYPRDLLEKIVRFALVTP
jgi:D-alanine--D-alanine ligase